MASYQLSNLARSTLSSPIGLIDTSIVVAFSAAFPTVPLFPIYVGPSGSTTGELMLVTGVVVSGATMTFTVQRNAESGSTLSAHVAGENVVAILSVAMLQSLLAATFPPWTALAAGGTATVGGASTALAVDTTGAATGANLPSSSVAFDGQIFAAHGIGASMSEGFTITAGSGTTMEDPNNAGTVGAGPFVVRNVPGFNVTYVYQAANTRWLIRGN